MAEPLSQGYGAPLGGARSLEFFTVVLDHVLERVHAEFSALVKAASSQPDNVKKQALLGYLHSARQQLLRLVDLQQWHPKAKALAACVDTGSALDASRQHAQLLEGAAMELFEGHMRRQPDFSPMFDVQTALEVLSTGSYQDLPYSIEQLRPAPDLTPDQQSAKLRRISHMIRSHLLKAHLPPGAYIAAVRPGFAVLRVAGLYEAKLTLVPAPDLPMEPTQSSGDGDAGAGAGGVAGQSGSDEDDAEATSGPKPVRWRWLLLAFILPANSVKGPQLQDAQIRGLLQDLNNRMHVAADAAVYNKRAVEQQAAAQEGGGQGVGVGGGASTAPAPSTSVVPSRMTGLGSMATGLGGGTSTLSGTSRALAAARLALLEAHEADEMSAPLVTLHCILGDLGGRLLLDAVRAVSEQLTSSGGRWGGGHAVLEPSGLQLRPGLRLRFWGNTVPLAPHYHTQTSQLLSAGKSGTFNQSTTSAAAGEEGPVVESQMALTPPDSATGPGTGAAKPGAGAGAGTTAAAAASSAALQPCVEIGLKEDGQVSVICTPLLHSWHYQPLSAQQEGQSPKAGAVASSQAGGPAGVLVRGPPLKLELDAPTINVDELLLRAAAALATHELAMLQDTLQAYLRELARLRAPWQLVLTSTPMAWVPEGRQQRDGPRLASAAAATSLALGGIDRPGLAPVELQQQSGDSHSHTTSSAGGSVIHVPVLQFWSHGELLLLISRSLITGRLLLQPGPGVAFDSTIESLHTWKQQREEELNSLLVRVYNQPLSTADLGPQGAGGAREPGSQTAYAAHMAVCKRVLKEVAKRVTAVCREQQHNLALSHTLLTARRLHLHMGAPGRRIIDAYSASHPWLDLQRHYALWSFPPHPSCQNMPLLYPVPPETPTWLQPHGLAFALGADHPRASAATYSLVVLAVSGQQTPLRVLQVVPVPTGAAQQFPGVRSRSPSVVPGVTVKQEVDLMLVRNEQQQAQQQPQQSRQHQGDDPWAAACAELEEAVRWCRVQMVVEKLKWQLQAVGAEYVELASSSSSDSSSDVTPGTGTSPSSTAGAGPRLMLVRIGGTRIPCHIPRRTGLGSRGVGIMSAVMEVVTPSSHMSDTSHSPSSDELVVVTVCGRLYDSNRSHQIHSSSAGQNAAVALHHTARASPEQQQLGGWQSVAPGVLQRTFCLSSSDTGATIIAELVAQVRLQLFLSRLEAMALPPQCLYVAAPTKSLVAACRSTAAGQLPALAGGHEHLQGYGELANGDVGVEALDRPAKRARSGHQPDSNGNVHHTATQQGHSIVKQEPGLESSAAGGSGVQSQQQHGTLCWRVPGVGSVLLEQYDPGGAVLVFQAPTYSSASSNSLAIKPDPGELLQHQSRSAHTPAELLRLRVQWQQSAVPGNGSAGVSCSIVRLPPIAGGGDVQQQSQCPQVAGTSDPTGPVASLLCSLQHMADAGEEGMLLDALVTCGGPLLAAEQVVHSLSPQQAGRAQGLVKAQIKQEAGTQGTSGQGGPQVGPPIASVRSSLPFRHTFLLPVPSAAGLGRSPMLPGTLELTCLAVGYTWLHFTISAASLGAAAEAGAGHSSAAQDADTFLAHLQHSLVRELRPGSVHVDYTWSTFMAPPQQMVQGGSSSTDVQSWSSGVASLGRSRQLWVLVANDQLPSALRVAFRRVTSG